MFFELDDIKRRHSNYYDIYNVNGWVRAPDSTLSWNYQRGLIAGLTASFINEHIINFVEGYRLLLRNYNPPNSLQQFGNFYFGCFEEIIKLTFFFRDFRQRNFEIRQF